MLVCLLCVCVYQGRVVRVTYSMCVLVTFSMCVCEMLNVHACVCVRKCMCVRVCQVVSASEKKTKCDTYHPAPVKRSVATPALNRIICTLNWPVYEFVELPAPMKLDSPAPFAEIVTYVPILGIA